MSDTQKRALLAVAAMVVLAMLIAGCGRNVVAKVGGHKITQQEYYDRLERLPYRDVSSSKQTESGEWVLERLITEELILRLADKEKVTPTDEQIDKRLAELRKQPGFETKMKDSGFTKDQLSELIRIDEAVFNLQTKGVKVTDAEIKAYYNENKDARFTEPESSYVSAIFVNSRADADKAIKLLEKGVDFGTVCRSLCSEPSLAARDGEIEVPIVRGDDSRVSKAVQDVIFNTPVGKFTKPISGGNSGYVIFKVREHQSQKTQKLADVEYQIKQQLMIEKGKAKNINLEDQMTEFRKSAKIEVNILRYKKQLLQKGTAAAPEETVK